MISEKSLGEYFNFGHFEDETLPLTAVDYDSIRVDGQFGEFLCIHSIFRAPRGNLTEANQVIDTVVHSDSCIASDHCHQHCSCRTAATAAATAAAARTVIASARLSHGVQQRTLAAGTKITLKKQVIAAHGIETCQSDVT